MTYTSLWMYLCIVVSTLVSGINTDTASREQLHNETVYPVVRVMATGGGGSGTIIYSDDRSKKGEFQEPRPQGAGIAQPLNFEA